MRYQSNLTAPDLAPYFRLLDPPMLTPVGGHDMPSDPDFLPACGFMTHDEAAILYHIATRTTNRWLDIGCRFGWSSAHIALAGREVYAIDPELDTISGLLRFRANTIILPPSGLHIGIVPVTSEQFFTSGMTRNLRIDAAMIDGNHDAPEPFIDAVRAIKAGASVLVWHDFQGLPVRDAVGCVMDKYGWHARVYWTPNGMAVAWRDGCGFVPPDHVPDPNVDWREIQRRMSDFDFGRCE